MASMVVPGEEAATTATTRRLTSTVWRGYTINRPADGGAPTATCLECGLTLCAGGKNGTSHLRRHIKSKKCLQQRSAERERERELCAAAGSRSTSPTTAAHEPSPGPGDDDHYSPPPSPLAVVVEDEEEEDCFTVDGKYIPELYDKLIAEGNNYVPAVAQAASSSTRWFINKTKERKKAENKKRCAPDDESSGLHVSAQPDFNSK